LEAKWREFQETNPFTKKEVNDESCSESMTGEFKTPAGKSKIGKLLVVSFFAQHIIV